MIEKGIIEKKENSYFEVIVNKTDACSKCKSCIGCNTAKKYKIQVYPTKKIYDGYNKGDEVTLFLSTKKYFLLFALFFLFPVLSMIVFYYVADYFFYNELFLIISTFSGLVLSFIILYLINSKFKSFQTKFSVKIISCQKS